MKRLIIMGLVSIVGILMVANARADVLSSPLKVKLMVDEIIELNINVTELSITPQPEDYKKKFLAVGNTMTTTGTPPNENYGFAVRALAFKITMFTNAKTGGTVYVHALGNPDHNKTLRVEDIYLAVMTEASYLFHNNITATATAYSFIPSTPPDYSAKWLQLDNEAQEIFKMTAATVGNAEWWLNIGIGNLARYTKNNALVGFGGYEADITFTLMPTIV